MLDGLHLYCKREKIDNFELIKRFSNENSERWDAAFIKRQVEIFSKGNLKKIWVCGPPKMNEVFEKTLMDMPQFNKITDIL